ncbi:Ig-like domain-containing protein, partial [Polaribacter sp.]|nr:Ig-like domain-containing protein [Polaribacter sp.]
MNIIVAQGATLSEALPFCSDSGANYPNTFSNGNLPVYVQETEPEFGCLFLGLRRNPTWYYLKVETSGQFNIQISATSLAGAPLDSDFIAWGPFTEDSFNAIISDGSGRDLTADKIVDCEKNGSTNPEVLVINEALAKEYYIVLLTNYSGTEGFIQLSELYPNLPETGTTDCFVNDPPVAVSDTATVEEDTSLTIDVISNDTDIDEDPLTLSFVNPNGSGTAAVNADGVSIDYTPAANFNGTETITYTVSDGELSDTTGTLTITVTAVNDAPVAMADTATVLEDSALTNIDIVSNDTDVEGDTLTLITATPDGSGTVSVNADGVSVDYTPAANFNGTETITYTVSDGTDTSTGTLTITVTAVNDAPVAVSDTATVEEDTSLTVDVISNDTDVDVTDTLTLITATPDGSGTVSVNADGVSVDYTPAANFNGTETITYTVSDGTDTSTGTLTITVTSVNDAPVAIADTASVDEDTSLTVDVILNDTDVDITDTLTLILATTDGSGTVSVNADGVSVDYTPAANFNGTETITYIVFDGTDTSIGTLTITVIPVNDAPVAVSDTATVLEDSALTNIDIVSNDTDVEGDTLTLTAATTDGSGIVSVNADGLSVDYTPAANFDGIEVITYAVSDGVDSDDTGILTITVTAIPEAPVAVSDTATLLEDADLTSVNVVSNDTDIDGDSLTLIEVDTDGTGTVAVNTDGVSVDYTPASNFNGTEIVTYIVSDGLLIDQGTLTLTINPVNDPPVAVSDTATLLEDSALTSIDVILNDMDVEG